MDEIAPGWTIERVRALGKPAPRVLPVDTYVVLDMPGSNDYEVLAPTAILDWGGLCLVRDADGEWYMGQLDASDGSIVCWASYGDDLERAFRAL